LKQYLRKFIFSFDHMTSGFQCPSVYRQTTDCTEGGGLTRGVLYMPWSGFPYYNLTLLLT
jgi:hypothetical protein